jgi:hypothetical protein
MSWSWTSSGVVTALTEATTQPGRPRRLAAPRPWWLRGERFGIVGRNKVWWSSLQNLREKIGYSLHIRKGSRLGHDCAYQGHMSMLLEEVKIVFTENK